VVETQQRLERLEAARINGGLCGWCGRLLDGTEAVYVDVFKAVAPGFIRPSSMRSRTLVRAPVGLECALPKLLATLAGHKPEACAGCGRGVLDGRVHAGRKLGICSRRCHDATSRHFLPIYHSADATP
jgi:hypothetical protein